MTYEATQRKLSKLNQSRRTDGFTFELDTKERNPSILIGIGRPVRTAADCRQVMARMHMLAAKLLVDQPAEEKWIVVVGEQPCGDLGRVSIELFTGSKAEYDRASEFLASIAGVR